MRQLYLRFHIVAVLLAVASGAMAQTSDNHNLEVAKQLEIFGNIYRALDAHYVDSLNPKETIETGINAMLESLDPYTEYYPQQDAKELKKMMTGKYAGIGSIVSYNFRIKRVCINEPYEGMPAQEVGLRKGDIILAIDGEDMTDKNVQYVSDHLRGDAGTTFVLTYQRPGAKRKTDVKITRRSIQMPPVPYYGMLNDTIGYINLDSFTDDCSQVVRHALISLKQQGMKKLVFDLRNNGGGSLQEAVKILNLFLPKDVVLVKTVGRHKVNDREYRTEALPVDTVMPVTVLVNGNTASASEIMSGCMQDLDRGIVIGTKTYGKGLVQVPIDMPYNGQMKFTTAHYYIPSGRCIQALKYKHKNGGSVETVADSLKQEFRTLKGRIVRGGGGITPDIECKADSMPNILYYLTSNGLDSTNVMMDYVVDYVSKHPTIAPARKFRLTDADYEEFKQRCIDAGFKYDRISERYFADMVKVAKFEGYYDKAKAEFDALEQKLKHDLAADLDFHREVIQMTLQQQICSCYYYQAGAIEAILDYDKQLQEAIK